MQAAAIARLQACRAYLLDMDGTLYVDEALLPGVAEFLDLIAERGCRRLFLTNNSARSGAEYAARLRRLGVAAKDDEVLTSGDATASFIMDETPHRSAYVVGTQALLRDFERAGVRLTEDDPDCVVIGFDMELTYRKLEIACRHLFAGKAYYATHPDRTCITKDGLIPDVLAIVAACEAVTRRWPRIIGKPELTMVRAALRKVGAVASETAMLGDQLDTDMKMARLAGLCPVLVESAETRRQASDPELAGERPILQVNDLRGVVGWLR